MAKNFGRNVLLPVILLVAFSTPFIFWDELTYALGVDLLEKSAVVLRYFLGILVWLLLAVVVNRLVAALIWDGLFERRLGRTVPRLLRDMFALLVFLAAVAGVIGVVFGKSLTLLAAATGGAGVVVGLAIRDMIADVFSGIALNVERPFTLGDFIRLESGEEGEVVEMNWRATHLRTTGNNIVIVPNNVVAARPLTNLHKAGRHFRVEFELWLDFNVPPERALRILNAAVKHAENTIPEGDREYPRPISDVDLESDAIAVDVSEFGIKYRVRFWLLRYTNWSVTRNRVISSVMAHLRRAGITPAYPQQDLYISRMPLRRVDESSLRRRMLQAVEIFSTLMPEELDSLSGLVERRLFGAGDVIIRRGDPAESMYVIAEGLVHVYIWVEAQAKEVKVANMTSGQFFGEMALLTGEPRSATILAATEVILYEITKDHLMGLLQERPAIAEQMTQVIAEHRMRDIENIDRLTPEEKAAESKNLVHQILGKIKSFFSLG